MMREHIQPAIAEFVGTFFLIFFGCGAIIVDQNLGGIFGLHGIAFAFGLIVMAIVYSIGHISGAHLNPAVTIALASVQKFPWCKAPLYIVAQCLGSIVAAASLNISIANGDMLGMTMPAGDLGQAFFLEMIMTAFLLFVVMGVGIDKRAHGQFAAIAVGAVIIIDILVGGAISGASMNPARSLGPALVRGNMEHFWLYIAGPVSGAILGAFLYTVCGFSFEKEST